MKGETLGIAVVGSGRIGTLRARMAAAHPSVRFLAVSDQDPSRAAVLAEKVGADFSSGDNFEVISRPEVDAVIVSTAEPEHTCPVLQALGRGKPVLVEKPIALRLEDADQMLAAAQRTNTELRVGYSLRFMRRYHLSKEQILQGRLGRLLGMTGRQFNTRAQGFAILGRSPHATPVMDALTYMVDMVGWFLEGNPPVEVVARGHGEVLRNAGYDVDDVTWAIVTFADGAVVNLGVSFALPEKFPTTGRTLRLEVLGTDGAMLIDEDHKDHILYTDKGIPHGYIPNHELSMAFLGGTPAGDWALGDFWGPVGSETRAWLDHLAMGRPCAITLPEEARQTLEVTIAIERASLVGEAVKLPLTGAS